MNPPESPGAITPADIVPLDGQTGPADLLIEGRGGPPPDLMPASEIPGDAVYPATSGPAVDPAAEVGGASAPPARPRTGIAEAARTVHEVLIDPQVAKSVGRITLSALGTVVPFAGLVKLLPGVRTRTLKEGLGDIRQKPWLLLPGVSMAVTLARESRKIGARARTVHQDAVARRAAKQTPAEPDLTVR